MWVQYVSYIGALQGAQSVFYIKTYTKNKMTEQLEVS